MPSEIDSGSATDSSVEDERQRQDIKKFTNSDKQICKITPRPNASGGYWLCGLLPLALLTHYVGYDFGCRSNTYDVLSTAAFGMGFESLCFFVYLMMDAHLIQLKLMISLLPGCATTWLYIRFHEFSWYIASIFGFSITILYQNAYVSVLRAFPNSFTYGEATIFVQGLMLFALNFVLQAPLILNQSLTTATTAAAASQENTFQIFNRIMLFALFCLLIHCFLLAKCKLLRKPIGFYITTLLLALIVTCAPITNPIPVLYLIKTIFQDENKRLLVFYYVLMLVLTTVTVAVELKIGEMATTTTRKLFHFLVLLVYIPGLITQCALLYIGTGVALALMSIIELLRICEIPPFKEVLKAAFQNFKDEKDAGLLALTPFCLLIGCSLPLWLMPCPCNSDCETHPAKMLAIMSGILTIGVGDTAASIVGSKWGKHKWKNTQRSVEGTLAFIVTVFLAIYCLTQTGYLTLTNVSWVFVGVAIIISALIEAYTDQIDNLVLPIVFYIVVNLAKEIRAY